ncbi:hypothetical protein PYCCODRAFT_1474632 [Trametes coccinea BRFM310]|uniref:Uncharacterized protein n=1 Tax=Trametes coccinea (strain BRFM310) TaxID=1353009 RepID=A0A1Y2IZC6_TRAC3|nr:hypothetical protein PYCCODRAFT_1474632 [Trametes coccinea BRFM310]
MSLLIAALAQFLNRNVWAPQSPRVSADHDSSRQNSLERSLKSLSGSTNRTTNARTVARTECTGQTPRFGSASDTDTQCQKIVVPSDPLGFHLSSGLRMDANAGEALACSPECDHSFCPPPRLIYSPASSSSLASDTPPPITPLGPGLSPPTGFPLLSPTGCDFLDSKPQLAGVRAGSTLAERRGAKALALQKSPTLADVPQPKLLSPRTPDTASSFAQRIIGYIRSPTPDSTSCCESPSPEYHTDPFGRASPSFFDDPYFFDAVSVRPHPDLYDLDVYQYDARLSHKAVAKKGSKPATAQIHVRVSDIEPEPALSVAVSHLGSQTHPSVPSSPTPTPSLDRPHIGAPSPAPIPASSLSPPLPPPHPHARSAPAPVPVPARRLSTASLPSSPLPYLRPLLLPQKFARREIAQAQSASILPLASPRLRPLILPQELARRATHPPRRTRPRPLSYPPSAGRLRSQHPHDLASTPPFKAYAMPALDASAPEFVPRCMDTVKEESGEEERLSRAEHRRSQPLDDLISLLDESGIIQDGQTVDENQTVYSDPIPFDSDESAGLATPPSILSRPGSSSSFSFISQPREESIDEVVETSYAEARKVEDILELLDVQQGDVSLVSQGDDELEVVEAVGADDVICAYAI